MPEEKIIRTYSTLAEENRDIDKMYEQGYTWQALSLGTIEFTKMNVESEKRLPNDCTH